MKHTKGIRRGRRNKNALKSITILYQNIRGLKSKFLSLQAIIHEQNPSIVCLVETFLTDPKSIQENETEEDDKEEDVMETLTIEGYIIVRKDRKNQYGGGCLIAYQERIKSLITEIESEETSLEALCKNVSQIDFSITTFFWYALMTACEAKSKKIHLKPNFCQF